MKRVALVFTAALGLAGHAGADVSGPWRVSGKISGLAFTLNCDFEPSGDKLGGSCVDTSTSDARVKAGKSHATTAGGVHGAAVNWTYRSNFLLSKFDVTYSGRLSGTTISGAIDAAGRQGVFTASKASIP